MDSDLEQLGERIAEQAAHLDAAMYRFLTDLREFDERDNWHTQGASSCAHWLAWRVGWDLVTGRERVRVARKLGEFAATLTRGAHIEVEGSLSSREQTIETNEGALTNRTFSVKAESIRKLDRAERESTEESTVDGRIEP